MNRKLIRIIHICIKTNIFTLEELQIGLRAVLPVCRLETGIDQQKEDNFRNGIVDVEDEKVQLFSECLIRKFNGYDDDGNLNEVVVREIATIYLNENEVNKLVAECTVITDANIHLKSSKLMKCFGKYTTLKEILNG
ncbi:odorant binding protein [Apis cerana cerana]|uniref:Odorant binding protein n=1 Tax=Apis cerana cerana TaxID=94128 RepID=A0A2A3EEQ2_APICC|nr:odorant binding protein [Apis cerana cerana]